MALENYLSKNWVCLKSAFIGAHYFVVGVSKKFKLKKPISNQLKYIRTLNILNKMINKAEKLPNHFSLTAERNPLYLDSPFTMFKTVTKTVAKCVVYQDAEPFASPS